MCRKFTTQFKQHKNIDKGTNNEVRVGCDDVPGDGVDEGPGVQPQRWWERQEQGRHLKESSVADPKKTGSGSLNIQASTKIIRKSYLIF